VTRNPSETTRNQPRIGPAQRACSKGNVNLLARVWHLRCERCGNVWPREKGHPHTRQRMSPFDPTRKLNPVVIDTLIDATFYVDIRD